MTPAILKQEFDMSLRNKYKETCPMRGNMYVLDPISSCVGYTNT